jgi:hypothetical protein
MVYSLFNWRETLCLVLIIFCGLTDASGQRWWGLNDSTQITLNADSTLIAGRKRLYLHTTVGGTLLVRDFSQSDSDYYIRDLDVQRPGHWWVVVGSRYIGNDSKLFRSTNYGGQWVEDTAYFQAARFTGFFPEYSSLNQLSFLGSDTIIGTVGYYNSGLVYSINGGQSWNSWFENLIVHYQGILRCGDSTFIYGYPGDGFRAMMFGFPNALLFSSDSTGSWSNYSTNSYHPACHNNRPGCIYPPFDSTTIPSIYAWFAAEVQRRCQMVSVETERFESIIAPYPNPFSNTIYFKNWQNGQRLNYELFNSQAQVLTSGFLDADYLVLDDSIKAGWYILVLTDTNGLKQRFPLLKQAD